jgi:molybdenum cofactor biosynthesis enzyme MoaA
VLSAVLLRHTNHQSIQIQTDLVQGRERILRLIKNIVKNSRKKTQRKKRREIKIDKTLKKKKWKNVRLNQEQIANRASSGNWVLEVYKTQTSQTSMEASMKE